MKNEKLINKYRKEFEKNYKFIGINNPFRKSIKQEIYQEFINKKFYNN